jgi:protein-disulfide isomerase
MVRRISVTHYRSVLSFALSMMLIARFAAAQEASPVAPATLKALLAAPLSTPPAGAPHGDVTVIEYFDYNCPVCRALEPQLQKLLATDQRVRLVRKDWPIFGDASVYAAYSSFAASREGRYQAAHDALIASSKDLDKKEDVLAVLEGGGL